MLGVFRAEPAESDQQLAPLPGLSDIPALVSRLQVSGLPVTLQMDPQMEGAGSGAPTTGVELAAFRIVQESLTNVVRHAGLVSTQVRLTLTGSELDVSVSNEGSASGVESANGKLGSGRGVVGMRERALAMGGTFDGGRQPRRQLRGPRRAAARPGSSGIVSESRVRVLVAEDQRLVRAGIVTMLNAGGDFDVVAEAADGQQAVSEARRTRPDVALLDIRMPIMDGIEATRRITAELPATAGARAHDVRQRRPRVLRPRRRRARVPAQGRPPGTAARSGVRRRTRRGTTGPIGHRSRGAALSSAHPPTQRRHCAPGAQRREHEVLTLMAKGMNNAEIAEALTVAPGTVKTHVATVLSKLGARDRLQAVIAAFETGLVRP